MYLCVSVCFSTNVIYPFKVCVCTHMCVSICLSTKLSIQGVYVRVCVCESVSVCVYVAVCVCVCCSLWTNLDIQGYPNIGPTGISKDIPI